MCCMAKEDYDHACMQQLFRSTPGMVWWVGWLNMYIYWWRCRYSLKKTVIMDRKPRAGWRALCHSGIAAQQDEIQAVQGHWTANNFVSMVCVVEERVSMRDEAYEWRENCFTVSCVPEAESKEVLAVCAYQLQLDRVLLKLSLKQMWLFNNMIGTVLCVCCAFSSIVYCL